MARPANIIEHDRQQTWNASFTWQGYLTEELDYPTTQVTHIAGTDFLGVYRDARNTQCLAIISTAMKMGDAENFHVQEVAHKHAAEFVAVGTPTDYKLYYVGPYTLIHAPQNRFPIWSPGLFRDKLISKDYTLLPFRDEDQLRKAFAFCHDAIFTQSAKDPAASFDLLSIIIAAKVMDETSETASYEFAELRGEDEKEAAARLTKLLTKARRWLANGDLCEADLTSIPALHPKVISTVFEQLQDYSLTLTGASPVGTDLLGVAYEQMVGATFRGDLGSYFTPRNIADFMVRLLDIRQGKVFDPSCGSGGLLIAAHRYTKGEGQDVSALNLYGNDLNPRMVEAAKVNFLVHQNDPGHVLHGDGLDLSSMLARWFSHRLSYGKKPLWDGKPGIFDFILANPPFAGHEKNEEILSRCAAAYRADGSLRTLNKTLPFLELIVAALREGGRAGVVIPTSILNAEEESFVRFRELLLKHVELLAIIGLPERAFVHTDCGVHGALLFFERRAKPRKDYEIFVGWADELGYDRLGKPTRKNDFPKLIQRYREGDWSVKERVSVKELHAYERWDPTWLRIVHSLPKSDSADFVPLSSLVEVRDARWSRKSITDDEQYRFFEVADADIVTGKVTAVQTASGFELAKKGRIRNQVRTGDILLPNHRDSLMATSTANGRSVVQVDEALDGVLTTDRFIILRPKIDPQLLIALLNSRGVRRQFVARCRGAASLDIREYMLKEVLVPKSLLGQKASEHIGTLVNEVDKLRNHLAATINQLSSMVECEFGEDAPLRPQAARR